jgi:hypothetical protein
MSFAMARKILGSCRRLFPGRHSRSIPLRLESLESRLVPSQTPVLPNAHHADPDLKVMTYNLNNGSDLIPLLAAKTPRDVVAAVSAVLAEVMASDILDRAVAPGPPDCDGPPVPHRRAGSVHLERERRRPLRRAGQPHEHPGQGRWALRHREQGQRLRRPTPRRPRKDGRAAGSERDPGLHRFAAGAAAPLQPAIRLLHRPREPAHRGPPPGLGCGRHPVIPGVPAPATPPMQRRNSSLDGPDEPGVCQCAMHELPLRNVSD